MKYLQQTSRTKRLEIVARDNGNGIDLLIKLTLSLTVYYFLIAGYLVAINSLQAVLNGSERFYLVTTILFSVIIWAIWPKNILSPMK